MEWTWSLKMIEDGNQVGGGFWDVSFTEIDLFKKCYIEPLPETRVLSKADPVKWQCYRVRWWIGCIIILLGETSRGTPFNLYPSGIESTSIKPNAFLFHLLWQTCCQRFHKILGQICPSLPLSALFSKSALPSLLTCRIGWFTNVSAPLWSPVVIFRASKTLCSSSVRIKRSFYGKRNPHALQSFCTPYYNIFVSCYFQKTNDTNYFKE